MADPLIGDPPKPKPKNLLCLDSKVALAALRAGFIISLEFVGNKSSMEYFFQSTPNPKNDPTAVPPLVLPYITRCCMYTATSNDPLRLRSVVFTDWEICGIIDRREYVASLGVAYPITELKLYAKDWDPGLQTPDEIIAKEKTVEEAIPNLIRNATEGSVVIGPLSTPIPPVAKNSGPRKKVERKPQMVKSKYVKRVV